MRILITGARAPACLEWARLLRRAGCMVAVADSAAVPLARFSACVERWFRLPAPVQGVDAYGAALLEAGRAFQADLILPTCEEAFYIAHQKRRLERQCPVFVAEFGLMARLHDKSAFAEFSRDLPISAPPTVRLESAEAVMRQAACSRDLVFKPVFSRFAARTLIRPAPEALRAIQPSAEQPWVAQEFTAGRELCSYSLLREGRLLAHSCYHPKYRVGQGSGIYLEPVESSAIRSYLHTFGKVTGYTGQAGFDFIETAEDRLVVLECNPRATSGIHLFPSQYAELTALLQPSQKFAAREMPLNASGSPRRVSVAMALFAAPKLRSLSELRLFGRDWRRASDIVHAPNDRGPVLAQMLGLGEVFYRGVRLGSPALSAATQDIEWNGQSLGAQP